MLPVPLCTPSAVFVTNVAVPAEVRTPSGIVPVALAPTDAQYWAPMPAAKLLVQFVMSLKLSKKLPPDIGNGTAADAVETTGPKNDASTSRGARSLRGEARKDGGLSNRAAPADG